MMKNEDNIQFEQMPDLDWGWDKTPKKESIEKEYNSLFDELIEKCHPRQFPIETNGIERFNIATDIYSQLLRMKTDSRSDTEYSLIMLRNRAIDELGIYISTKKKVDFLKSVLNPEQYLNGESFDRELVNNASCLYDQVLKNQKDIRTLEVIENDPRIEMVKDEYDYQNIPLQEYLEKHPYGKHLEEATRLVKITIEINKDDECFQTQSASSYLDQYPEGRHADEANCYLYNKQDYLKLFPNGKYADLFVEKNDGELDPSNVALFFIIFFVGIVCLIIALA